jgi:Stage II sporulation protein M
VFPSIWSNASPRRKRIYSIIAVFIVSVIFTSIGSLMPVDPELAKQISDELNQTTTMATQGGMMMQYILGNNFFICLIMFIPVIGPIFGLYVLFNTGMAVSAIAVAEGYPSILVLVALVITPIFWLEFLAYSTAMAGSVWLLRRALQRRGWHELRNTSIFISLCAVLLALGAVVETALIAFAV